MPTDRLAPAADSLPCDTYECDDRLWCIQRRICKRGAEPESVIGPATPDNAAMRCLLEEMRDNPGAISVGAARGAVIWALGRIATLEALVPSHAKERANG